VPQHPSPRRHSLPQLPSTRAPPPQGRTSSTFPRPTSQYPTPGPRYLPAPAQLSGLPPVPLPVAHQHHHPQRQRSAPSAYRLPIPKPEINPAAAIPVQASVVQRRDDIKDYCAVLTPFIYKLYCLVSDEATNDLCCWSDDGRAFLVRDTTAFAASVLPNYFKHNQFSSFVRQLNKYRFHKLAPGAFLFGHDRFVRGRPDLLPEIGRQRSPDRTPTQSINPLHSHNQPPHALQHHLSSAHQAAGPSGVSPPALKRPRRFDDTSTQESIRVEIEPLRGDVAVLRRENAHLNARLQSLEDTVAGLRHRIEFLTQAISTGGPGSQAAARFAGQTGAPPVAARGHVQHTTPQQQAPADVYSQHPSSASYLPPPSQTAPGTGSTRQTQNIDSQSSMQSQGAAGPPGKENK